MSTSTGRKKKDYANKKWKQKRSEIISRDNGVCRICGEESDRLNVHHIYYFKDAKPWDYPSGALISLCPRCHGKIHSETEKVFNAVYNYIYMMNRHKYTMQDLCDIISNATSSFYMGGYEDAIDSAISPWEGD